MPVGEQGPGTAEQQIRFEVAIDKTLRAAAGMFGIDYESQAAGGGGTGGKWVFTSVDQLDDLIKEWTDVGLAIQGRLKKIRDAQALIYPPADDILSRFQADGLADSLEAMAQHADSMYKYADTYVQKLADTRSAYVNTEGDNTARMKDAY
ncbi:hypothetical protein KIPE111705_35610 [Kibdelosporangium persicum]|uniref:PE domain-containing protein n=1 Tax=Kibdelosporangium persicum TaxID=2698649 RepID=A0ABX2FE81_9PSEU|nr:hypothetical protein [Kibdelosporangium persicum]NRN69060.1 hypothetical protein [Kibdelosporangium persicum]